FHMSPRARVIAEGGEGIQPDDRAQLQADRARYQRLKQAIQEAAPDSDDFSFDDTKQQIDFRGNYFQLSQLTRTNLKLRDEFNGLADTHSGEPGVDTRTQFDGAFSSPQYRDARRNQLTAALANARDFDYSAYDTRSGPEAQAALRARMRGTAAQKMRALLDGRDGFIVSETHSDKNPKDLLAKNMDGLKKAGVKTLYLEHFRHGEHQGALDAFNDGGELPDDRTFQRQLNGIPGLKGLLTAARANGVRVVAIDDAIAKADTPNNDGPQRFGVERAARMNFVSADVIDTTRQRPDPGKYVVLIGAKHTNTHEGGIPGMAQILNVPAVRVRPGTGDAPADVELDAENTALRAPPRPPGGGEQAANTGAN
ncbi:MAG: membrane-targeted effector domain-containing toxin, partial [Myxococcota bacterium]